MTCKCQITQGRQGEKGSWCVACGRKVFEVETRPCSGCKHHSPLPGGAICRQHLMRITPCMLVTYKTADGTCWEQAGE